MHASHMHTRKLSIRSPSRKPLEARPEVTLSFWNERQSSCRRPPTPLITCMCVCVCMYVIMYVYTYTYPTYVCKYICMYIHIHTSLTPWITWSVCVCVCACVCMYDVCMHAHTITSSLKIKKIWSYSTGVCKIIAHWATVSQPYNVAYLHSVYAFF
jgi:hypothetical protein